MNWNKKHDKFALACNLSESQALVLRDAMGKAKRYEPTEIEMDLRVTNRWIGKVRPKGEFHRKTMTNVMGHLDEKTQGMVTVLKKYNPWVYKILIRPLAFVERIQSAKCESIPKLTTGNPMFSEDHKNRLLDQQQQDIETIKSLFDKLGMEWSDQALLKIWQKAGKNIHNVKEAIDFMLHANTTQSEPIRKPHAWFIRCIERGDYKLFAHQLFYQLPRFANRIDLMSYINQFWQTPFPAPS